MIRVLKIAGASITLMFCLVVIALGWMAVFPPYEPEPEYIPTQTPTIITETVYITETVTIYPPPIVTTFTTFVVVTATPIPHTPKFDDLSSLDDEFALTFEEVNDCMDEVEWLGTGTERKSDTQIRDVMQTCAEASLRAQWLHAVVLNSFIENKDAIGLELEHISVLLLLDMSEVLEFYTQDGEREVLDVVLYARQAYYLEYVPALQTELNKAQ